MKSKKKRKILLTSPTDAITQFQPLLKIFTNPLYGQYSLAFQHNQAEILADQFEMDLKDAEKLDLIQWKNRPQYQKLTERIIRLLSPFL